ncbi:MAG: hypothetical protein AAGD07_16410 [Planctomycetota bacterium]
MEMSTGLSIGTTQSPEIRGMQGTTQVDCQLEVAEIIDREPQALMGEGHEDDALEPPQVEDFGDSQHYLVEQGESSLTTTESAVSPHEVEDDQGPPPDTQIPLRSRPLVRFRIDKSYRVHELISYRRYRREMEVDRLRRIIAQQIALHLQRYNYAPSETGQWCHIPALTMDDIPAHLDSEADRRRLASALKSSPKRLKRFAILLPNGEAVSVEAINTRVFKKKGEHDATLAGVLRLHSNPEGIDQVCGRVWTHQNKTKLNRNIRDRRRRHAEKREKPKPR